MNRWNSDLENSPLWAQLEEVSHLAQGPAEADLDPEVEEEKRRFSKLIAITKAHLTSADAELVQPQTLATMRRILDGSLSNLRSFSTSGNIANIKAANDSVNGLSQELATLAPTTNAEAKEAVFLEIERQFGEFTQRAKDETDGLKKEVKEVTAKAEALQKEVDQLHKSAEQLKTSNQTQSAQWLDQFSKAQHERQQEHNEALRQFRSNSDKAVSDFKEKFEAAASDVVTTNSETLLNLVADTTQKLETQDEEVQSKLQALIEESREKRNEIVALHSLFAGESAAAKYQEDAKAEKKAADDLRGRSTAFILTAAGWLFVSVASLLILAINGVALPWPTYIPIFSLSAVLLFGGIYSSMQSRLHRENQRRNQWLALKVQAFEPFTQSLDEAKRDELRVKIAEEIFGSEHQERGGIDLEHAGNALSPILKPLTDFVAVLKK